MVIWCVFCLIFDFNVHTRNISSYFHSVNSPWPNDVTDLGYHWPTSRYGPVIRYPKLRVARAPGMPGTFSPPPRVSDPDMHHGTCVTHVTPCMPGSLASGFLWSQWRRKRFRHSRRMRNPRFYVSGKRPMACCLIRVLGCISEFYTFTYIHGWPSTQPGSLHIAVQRKYTQPCSLFSRGTAVWTMGVRLCQQWGTAVC